MIVPVKLGTCFEITKDHALNECLMLNLNKAHLKKAALCQSGHNFLLNDPALIYICWSVNMSRVLLFSHKPTLGGRYCGEANVTTPGDAPIRDWSALPSCPISH